MTCRIENGVTYSQAYNAENRISSIAKRTGDCATGTILESWSFAYDGDGTRVSTAHFTGTSGTPDSTTSNFMGGQFEVKDGATKKYYSIAGMMVAMNDGSGLQYLLTDHLGSTVAVTNSSGTLTSQQRYLPFGAPRTIPNSPILGTDFTYTGQRKLDDGMGGIMDYKARFYSVGLGRFLQPDTIIPDQTNPQSWNRYSYVGNCPSTKTDPTGHKAVKFDNGKSKIAKGNDCKKDSLSDGKIIGDTKLNYNPSNSIYSQAMKQKTQFIGRIRAGDLREIADQMNYDLYDLEGPQLDKAAIKAQSTRDNIGSLVVGTIMGELVALAACPETGWSCYFALPLLVDLGLISINGESVDTLLPLKQTADLFSLDANSAIPDDEWQTLSVSVDESSVTINLPYVAEDVTMPLDDYNQQVAPYLNDRVCSTGY